ncbi:hypothetical protein [Nitrospirillum amazonense]|uniref:hypothetical protein n=1 Tax=Nitrospirillum amazonense TaxID=28077 RepID=UPI0011A97353|nr:hypothetical protein [Nitrospirillum amazonense]
MFDIKTGEVTVEGISLHKGQDLASITVSGISFFREFDIGNGWVHRNSGPHIFYGRKIITSMKFFAKKLMGFNIYISDINATDSQQMKPEHDNFLENILGVPAEIDKYHIIYKYSWGEIISYYDPRGGDCAISVSWI